MNWRPRIALESDIPALEELIPHSARRLQAGHYSQVQIEAALGPVFGVDRQLIRDRSYYVVESDGRLVGAGGWSRRRSLFGGDRSRSHPDLELDPQTEPARIRAFFVHPDWARRGIGQALLAACESAIGAAGFRRAELVATLTGEPLYARAGYQMVERYAVQLEQGVQLPVIRMSKHFHT